MYENKYFFLVVGIRRGGFLQYLVVDLSSACAFARKWDCFWRIWGDVGARVLKWKFTTKIWYSNFTKSSDFLIPCPNNRIEQKPNLIQVHHQFSSTLCSRTMQDCPFGRITRGHVIIVHFWPINYTYPIYWKQ